MSAETLVAEALAVADPTNADLVPASLSECRYLSVGQDAAGWWRVFSGTNDSVPAPEYNAVRRDVMDAALRHLAERVEAAEKEAKHAYGLAAGYATAAKEAEERATSLRAAIGAAFEVAAGCDGPEFERVFSIAHDALESCKGCFPEGGPSRPLVPTIAVEQAEARAKEAEERVAKAEAALDAVARQGWRACVLLAAGREREETDFAYAEAEEAHAQGEATSRDWCIKDAEKHAAESLRLRLIAKAEETDDG